MVIDDPGVHPLYDAVGRAVIAAAQLEMWFNILASSLADLDSIDVAKMRRKEVKRAVLNAASLLPADERESLEDLAAKVWTLTGTRDAIVHQGTS